MVAYSFQKQFVAPIRSGQKRQTIRAFRKRHARPGEALQLYAGMRTKHCFKIIDDPVCAGVDEVRLDFSSVDPEKPFESNQNAWARMSEVSVSVNGYRFPEYAWNDFARDDGFDGLFTLKKTGEFLEPFVAMAIFWIAEHGPIAFQGVRIRWEAQS